MKLYDIMAACEKLGYYQMAVEELQRRLLTEVGTQARRLADAATRVEALTSRLDDSVQNVDRSVRVLPDSSNKMERLTKWIVWFTVALLFLTVAQLVASGVQVVYLLKNEDRVAARTPPISPATIAPPSSSQTAAREGTKPGKRIMK